jgi:proteasome lid subunit RPN8/RPN11
VILKRSLIDNLLVRAMESPYEEVCGVFLRGKHIPMLNVHPNRRSNFAFDGERQLEVWAEWGGAGDLIIYHSHPRGTAKPSRTDIDAARDHRIYYLILSVKYGELYLYRVDAGEVVEEELIIQ